MPDQSPPGWSTRLAYIFIVLLLPLVFMTLSVRIEMNSPGLYSRAFYVYDAGKTTGFDEAEFDRIVVRLIDYFNSTAVTPQMEVTNGDGVSFELYHDYELIHLADVKSLFDLNSLLQSAGLLALVLLAALGLSRSQTMPVLLSLRYGAVLALSGLVVGAVLFTIDFGEMFVNFHLLLFDNPFWQLDPRTDYLVMLFPFGFWQDMFMVAGVMTAAFSLATLATTELGLRRLTMRATWRPGHGKPDV